MEEFCLICKVTSDQSYQVKITTNYKSINSAYYNFKCVVEYKVSENGVKLTNMLPCLLCCIINHQFNELMDFLYR